jgi:hypothetical protein
MRPLVFIGIDVWTDLFPGGVFIGIAADDVDLLLFNGAEESFCEGIIGGSSVPGQN